MNLLYIDVETTGLDPVLNDVINLGCIVEVNNKIVDKFEYYMYPTNWSRIDKKAMNINGIDIENCYHFDKCVNFITPTEAATEIYKIMSSYKKDGKLIAVGKNVKFDINFINNFFSKNIRSGGGNFYDIIRHRYIDINSLLLTTKYCGSNNIDMNDMDLENLQYIYNIQKTLNPHNALHDAILTAYVFQKIILNDIVFISNSNIYLIKQIEEIINEIS
jgi:DNA polymerase-3 subunit epsilon